MFSKSFVPLTPLESTDTKNSLRAVSTRSYFWCFTARKRPYGLSESSQAAVQKTLPRPTTPSPL